MKQAGELKSRNRRMIGIVILSALVILITFLSLTDRSVTRTKQYNAQIYGETVAAKIELALTQYLNVTETLETLYLEFEDDLLTHFPGICRRKMARDDVIGSLYVAPGGVIAQAYPEEVAASTIGFDPRNDPEQGEATMLAINSGETTVAGPHALVEGGTGFIIRNPVYDEDDGSFKALVIVVLDWDRFVQSILSQRGENSSYHFAVWSDADHILTDEQGYIFKCHEGEISRRLDIPIEVPNGMWHLTVEPDGGWSNTRQILPYFLTAAVLLTGLALLVILAVLSNRQRKQLELEKAANAAKSVFLSNMSHDIRTPMNAVIGFTNLALQQEDQPEKVHEYLTRILSSGNHLLSLINDVLEMSRIESGKITLEEAPCSLKEVLGELYAITWAQIQEKQLTFTIDTEGIRDDCVCCDRLRLNQILLNLLSNAIKFTPEGGEISVKALQLDDAQQHEAGNGVYEIHVKDNGIGMSEEFSSRIFEAFERERTSTVSRTQGTGLGMSITRRLLDMMNGTITVASKQGEGSEFTVTLPLRLADEADLPKSDHVSLHPADAADAEDAGRGTKEAGEEKARGKRLLLVDDMEINRMLAKEILLGSGYEVEEAPDGDVAVEMVEQSPPGYYDAVLMDIQMPSMNGYDATRAIRAMDDEARSRIPIIAMTANAFDEDKKMAAEAGMDAHVMKPIDVAQLLQELDRLLRE